MDPTGAALTAALHQTPAAGGPDLAQLPIAAWDAVADLAIRQRVGPLLYALAPLPIPVGTRARLKARAEASARRVLGQMAAFRSLADRLDAQGISVIVLKGLHLATTVYPSAGLREMNDIDILVRLDDLETAANTMRDLGYRAISDASTDLALRTHHHLPPFVNRGVGLEIHWQLGAPGRPPCVAPDDLWARSEPSALAPNARVLDREDTLIHICVHAGQVHLLEMGLRPLCDIQAMVQRWGDTLDWDVVAERSKEWECDRSVALLLRMTEQVLGITVPARVHHALSAVSPGPLVVESATALVFAPAPATGGTSPEAGRLLMLSGLGSRITHLWSRTRLNDDMLETMFPTSTRGWTWRMRAIAHRVVWLLQRHAWPMLRASVGANSPVRTTIDHRNVVLRFFEEAD